MDLVETPQHAHRPPSQLLGRDADLERVGQLLKRLVPLVVTGPRGAGLTSFVEAAAAAAAGQGMIVLRATGVQAEAHFPGAALHQLLRPLRDGLDRLPEASRDALRASAGEGDGRPLNRFLIGSATLALLSTAAEAAPVLICVDDAQWLDGETHEALAFISRRLAHERVTLLIGTHDQRAVKSLDLGEEVHLSPLTAPAARDLLERRDPALSVLARGRVLRHAAGNPLALVELPVAYQDAQDEKVLSTCPLLTARLEEAFGLDLQAFPQTTAVALRIAALDGDGGMADMLAAASVAASRVVVLNDLDPALSLGVLEVNGDRVRFTHDLHRAAVHGTMTPAQRQAGHEALAQVLSSSEPDRATWHRGCAAPGADEGLAAQLEAGGRRARERGDFERATAYLCRAVTLTPADVSRNRRRIEAAELAQDLGAVRLADRLVEAVTTGRLDTLTEARLTALSHRLHPRRGEPARTAELVSLAQEVAANDAPALAVRCLLLAATELQALGRGGNHAADVVDAAENIVAEPDAPALLSIIAACGSREREARILAGLERHTASATRPEDKALLGHAALSVGHPHLAARLLAAATPEIRAQNRLPLLGQVLALAARARLSTSEWDEAERDGIEAVQIATQVRQPLWGALANTALASIAALRGDEHRAASHAAAAERVAIPARATFVLALALEARGLAALSAGRRAEALADLRRPFDPHDPAHDRAAATALLGDLAEAATTDEERTTARRLLDEQTSEAPLPRVAVAHARLVLAPDAEADEVFDASFQSDGDRWPFVEARMLLIHGMRLRRRRRVAESRGPLRAAADQFAVLNARPWAERARVELAATAETTHRSDGDLDRLTPRELDIARLAARGLTNREIAAALSMSPRTVGHHLARIFPKLGVTARTGIAAALDRAL